MNKKLSFLITVTLFLSLPVLAQDWVVPAAQKDIANPQEYNLANVKKGKELFLKNCKSCHGDPGKNNILPLSDLRMTVEIDVFAWPYVLWFYTTVLIPACNFSLK